jgi:hypothetical protein
VTQIKIKVASEGIALEEASVWAGRNMEDDSQSHLQEALVSVTGISRIRALF